jgi:hypothetical protein
MAVALRTFNSLNSFAAHLLSRDVAVAYALATGLETVARRIRDTAKGELGEYQPEVEHFNAWAQLAPDTMAHHIQVIVDGDAAPDAGENTPLLLTGGLRESIKSEVGHNEAVIGSEADEGVWMELGTDRAPPRPFLGPALVRNEEWIQRMLGRAVVSGLLGEGVESETEMTSRQYG